MDTIATSTSKTMRLKILKYTIAILLTLNTITACMAGSIPKTAPKQLPKELKRDGQHGQLNVRPKIVKINPNLADYAANTTNKPEGKDIYKITHYCNCYKCTGKNANHPTYGITASGKPAQEGFIACNWLPFNTRLLIDGKVYTAQDRGAKSLFGDKKNHIKRLDIWTNSHKAALNYGVKYKQVEILKGK